jgi:hypothetical protein
MMATLAANKNSLKNIDLLTLLWAWNLKSKTYNIHKEKLAGQITALQILLSALRRKLRQLIQPVGD